MSVFLFYMAVFSVIFGVAVAVSAIYEYFFW
jgi:hypothetical protein